MGDGDALTDPGGAKVLARQQCFEGCALVSIAEVERPQHLFQDILLVADLEVQRHGGRLEVMG